MMNYSGRAGTVAGLAAALFGAAGYLWWWMSTQNPINVVTITLGAAFAALIVTQLIRLFVDHGKGANTPLTLVVAGLWIFLICGIAGLAVAGAIIRGDHLVASTFTIRMLFVAAFIAAYAVALFAVRHRWILLPMAQLHGIDPKKPDEPDPNPMVSPFAAGYFIEEYRLQRSHFLRQLRLEQGADLLKRAGRALSMSESIAGLKAQHEELAGLLVEATKPPINRWLFVGKRRTVPSGQRIRQLSASLYEAANGQSKSRDVFLMKVQNQLAVVALFLLVTVGAFAATGWVVPMALAGVAALIFRIRKLMPEGDPAAYDGGARWMALFITPLLGAVSAVIGLLAIAALVGADVLSDTLGAGLELPEGLGIDSGPQEFGILALGIAIAFGWSARLLDTMLSTLSDRVSAPAPAEESSATATPSDGQ
ncbi:MAG: hypothetical protein ACTHXA_09005 [Gulosibacter sp.]|uniref:hypothetical protein n=1 Tax=Gulosibacter sp. TaxID=2817531 RepID=UPI003F8DAB28